MAAGGDDAGVGGGRSGGERADVPALRVEVRGGRSGGASGRAGGRGLAPAGAGGGGGGAGGAVRAGVRGLERAALPRAVRGGSRWAPVVHVGEEPPPGGGPGEAWPASWPTPAETSPEAPGGADGAPGRLHARVGAGAGVGSDRDVGRRDGAGVLRVLRGGGGDVVELPGRAGDGGGEGAVRQPVHGSRLALLAHPQGRGEGGPEQADPVRAGDGGVGDRDDPVVLAAGAGAVRAPVPDASGTPAQRVGARGDRGHGGGERVPRGVLAPVQRGVRGGGGRGGDGVRAAVGREAGRHPVPAGGADGGQRQLRVVPREAAPDRAPAAPVSTTCGRRSGYTSTRTGACRCSTTGSGWAATTGRDVRWRPRTGREGRRDARHGPRRGERSEPERGPCSNRTCYVLPNRTTSFAPYTAAAANWRATADRAYDSRL